MSFCKYCGRKIEYDAVYCSGCGKKLEVSNNKTQRETVFEGNLHKCPNCGEIVNSFLANCTSCGHEFRETKVVSSVELLSRELKDIDAKSLQSGDKNTIFSDKFSLSTTDKAKIDLIKNPGKKKFFPLFQMRRIGRQLQSQPEFMGKPGDFAEFRMQQGLPLQMPIYRIRKLANLFQKTESIR